MEATDKSLVNHKKVETVDAQSQEERKVAKVVYAAEEVVTGVIIVIEATVEKELKTCWMIVI